MRGKIAVFLLCTGVLPFSLAFENMQHTVAEQNCFAQAMVGMDSVINASLGVPPEHALDLIVHNGNLKVLNEPESINMLNVILNAYFWQESPHSYAIRVFFRCAQNTAISGQTVANEPLPVAVEIPQ